MAASNMTNTASHIKSINGTNISNVSITGNNLGIVIEKSSTNKFELDYAGVKNQSNFTFHDTITSDGTLTITASANSLVNYISADPNNKVNVINSQIGYSQSASLLAHNLIAASQLVSRGLYPD